MPLPAIIVAQPMLMSMIGHLEPHYDVLRLWEPDHVPRLPEARAIVVGGAFPELIEIAERLPALGLVACAPVGYEWIDLAWARRRSIAVTNGQNANDDDVADHAIGLIIAFRRAIVTGDAVVRQGKWLKGQKALNRSLSGETVGIVGLGGIGKAVAVRAEAMRMGVRWWGPSPKPDVKWPKAESLVRLARESDILVVAARAHPGNVRLISSDVIDALGPDGLLVNVARGSLIDETALVSALKDGRVGGAALDVFETEPTPSERWNGVPNTILTPHIAGATHQAVDRMAEMLLANLAAFFADRPLPNRVDRIE